jgi:hypothetical protein
MPVTAKPKKPIPKWVQFLVLGIVLFVALLITLSVFIDQEVDDKTKEAVVVSNQVVNDIQNNDVDAVYAITTSFFQQDATKEQLAEIFNKVSPLLQGNEEIYGKKIQTIKDGKEQATILYKIDTTDGTVYIRVILQNDGTTWKLAGYTSSDTSFDL